jgi:hypothetical protein
MKTWQSKVLVLAAVLAAGCGELASLPTEVPHEGAPRIDVPHDSTPRIEVPSDSAQHYIAIGSQQPPGDVPQEFLGHYTWLDVSVDVGWSSPTQAYGQAIVRYWASNVTASIDLSVRNDKGTIVGQNSGASQDWFLLPKRGTLYASTNVTVSGTCGHIAQAKAGGSVWDSAISSAQGLLAWGNKSENAANSAVQPTCAPTTCLDASATNYGGPLPCAYPPPPPPPSGGDGSAPPPSESPAPPTYQPAPFVPNGHWECTIWYMGTDYEREYCTWYTDYARIAAGDATRARSAIDVAAARTALAADLPSVFVIVSDQVPADAMAVIERRRQGPFKNVLLVPSASLRPAAFVAALRALADSRARDGETPTKDLQLTLKGSVLDQQIPRAARDYAAAFTALVARAKHGDAGSYGTRQILEIRLGDRR